MPTSTPPPWTDDLFPFATPAAFATLVDIAWRHSMQEGYYDWIDMTTLYDFMFDLAVVPRPPEGWECSPEFNDGARRLPPPFLAPPEFVPFGSLGDGGYVGWLVPAPELKRADHPVALASGHEHGVTLVGADTRAGLEFMLSRALRRWGEQPTLEPPAWRDPDVWRAQNQYRIDAHTEDRRLLDQLAAELGVHPDPDIVRPGLAWDGETMLEDTESAITFDVPEGWRHESGEDGIGVLAPADAYADEIPPTARDPDIESALRAAASWLDAGHPATALLALKNTFVHAPTCRFADLAPLWSRAYRDLGRPEYAERLDSMLPFYQDPLLCFCRDPH